MRLGVPVVVRRARHPEGQGSGVLLAGDREVEVGWLAVLR